MTLDSPTRPTTLDPTVWARPLLGRLARGVTRTLLTPHPTTHYARSLGVDTPDDASSAAVLTVHRPVPDYTVLTLRLPTSAPRPRPGAALAVGVVVDGVVHRRHYSPVDPERDDRPATGGIVTLAVRRHPGGLVSEHLWEHAEPGMRLLLDGPVGELGEPASPDRDVLLVSGGSGLTPMLSIAATRAGRRGRGLTAWLHYARGADAVPFRDRLGALEAEGITVRIVDTTREGRLSRDQLDSVAPWRDGAEILMCGPDALADGLASELGPELASSLRRERFAAETLAAPADDTSIGGNVTHARSGVVARNAGTTLLTGAEDAGLAPAHGCRMGICHTCTAVRLSGATRDLRTGQTDSTPGGRVQICVSAPVGDVELDL